MLVGKRRTRQSIRQSVRHRGSNAYARSRTVGADNFQILRPLEAEVINRGRRDGGIPICDENALVGHGSPVRRIRIVVGRNASVIGIGRLEIVKVKGCTKAVSRRDQVIQLSKPYILILKSREAAQE